MKSNNHQQRIKAVIDYIYAELDSPKKAKLSLAQLSQVACFSKYHFHRIFAATTGQNLSRYILMLKLKKAAYQLAFQPNYKIIDVALDAGFENHESFTRAFKNTYGLTPSQFKQKPDWLRWSENHNNQFNESKNMKNELLEKIKIEICHFPKTLVAVLEHHGDERLINQSIAQFIAWRKQTAESPITQSETFGLAYNDPEMTPKDEYRFDICGSVKNPVKANNYGIITKTIPAGRCAKITHHGPYQSMGDKIRYLYAHWIIEKDIELRNFPCFFQYRNLFPQVQENQLVTDIYLPIW